MAETSEGTVKRGYYRWTICALLFFADRKSVVWERVSASV